MGAQPVRTDSEARTLLDQLDDVRLARDWSYRQLADDIARLTPFVVSAQTLQPLLTRRAERPGRPYDRTLHKVRLYLAALAGESSSKSRKAKGHAA